MTAPLVFALSMVAFAAFALSMRRHYRDVFGTPSPPARRRLLRWTGALLLAASILCAIADDAGAESGLALWFGQATTTALIVAMAMTWLSPRQRSGHERL